MGTEIELSKRQQLLATAVTSLAQIENCAKADEKDAARAAHLLIASYQQKPSDPEVYMRQVRELLIGVPMETVLTLVSAKNGIFDQCPAFLPGIGEIRKWIDDHEAPRRSMRRSIRNEIDTLKYGADPEPISNEEKERRIAAVMPKPQKQGLGTCEWLKPETEQSPAERRERKRLERHQAKDHSALLQTDLVRAPKTEAEEASTLPQPHRQSA